MSGHGIESSAKVIRQLSKHCCSLSSIHDFREDSGESSELFFCCKLFQPDMIFSFCSKIRVSNCEMEFHCIILLLLAIGFVVGKRILLSVQGEALSLCAMSSGNSQHSSAGWTRCVKQLSPLLRVSRGGFVCRPYHKELGSISYHTSEQHSYFTYPCMYFSLMYKILIFP